MVSNRLKQLILLASGASAAQNVVYWGQNGGGTVENNDLSTYCTSTSGIDILVLAFLCTRASFLFSSFLPKLKNIGSQPPAVQKGFSTRTYKLGMVQLVSCAHTRVLSC